MTIFGEVCHVESRSRKICLTLHQSSDLQAERRGNFVVIGCIDGARVVSWSLNVS